MNSPVYKMFNCLDVLLGNFCSTLAWLQMHFFDSCKAVMGIRARACKCFSSFTYVTSRQLKDILQTGLYKN